MNHESIKKILSGIFALDLKLTDDETKYVDKKGVVYNRVSDLKADSNDINKASTVRGDTIDEMVRTHFSRLISMDITQFVNYGKETLKKVNIKKKTEVEISDKAFEELFSILEGYKKFFIEKNWKIHTSIPTLAGNIGKTNYAGTIDILAYDKNTKEFIIIDLKTSSVSRKDTYDGTIEDKFNYVEKDAIQQNAYAELFEQMTGKKITKLFILPLIVPKESKTSFNVDEILLDGGEFLKISTEKNIYELKNIQKQVVNKSIKSNHPETEVIRNDNLLNAFGFKPPTVTATTSPVRNVSEIQKSFVKDIKNNNFNEMVIDGVQYMFGLDSMVIAESISGNIITDEKKTIYILEKFNKQYHKQISNGLIPNYDINKVKKVWNSQKNSVSLSSNKKQEVKKQDNTTNKPSEQFEPYSPFDDNNDENSNSGMDLGKMFGVNNSTKSENKEEVEKVEKIIEKKEVLNFNKFTDEQVQKGLSILEEHIKDTDLKHINNIYEKSKSDKKILEKIYNYLTNKYNAELITNELKKCS